MAGAGWEQERAVDALGAVWAEDEHAPHVVVVMDDALGPGPAAGPFYGALRALAAAERLQAALNAGALDPPVRTRVVRLFTPPTT
jgi:beta-lactamase class A